MGTFQKYLYYEGAEMKSKDEIFDAVLDKEGGYVNHPDDKGGPTKWGITGKVARAHGYQGDIRDLTRGQASKFLKRTTGTGHVFTRLRACLRRSLLNCVIPA